MYSDDVLMFFSGHPAALPLYGAFVDKLSRSCKNYDTRVQKTQISFSNRHVFACISFARVRKKAELPDPYIVVTLGLPTPLDSERIAVKTEAYPGRWTHHIVIGSKDELDDVLMKWTRAAYDFSMQK